MACADLSQGGRGLARWVVALSACLLLGAVAPAWSDDAGTAASAEAGAPAVDAQSGPPFGDPAAVGSSDAGGGEVAPVPWSALRPEQQQALSRFSSQWNSLPPRRQRALARRAQRWLNMSPEQRAWARARFNAWQQMSPQRRALIRQRWQQFRSLPPAQQQRIRESYRRFQHLPPAERQQLRQRWQQATPAQRQQMLQQLRQQRGPADPGPGVRQ